jgi:hypothetical protein
LETSTLRKDEQSSFSECLSGKGLEIISQDIVSRLWFDYKTGLFVIMFFETVLEDVE